MPKWIGSSKRRHPPKDNHQHKHEDSEEEKAPHNGGVVVHQGRRSSGASVTSDSGRSMSPESDSGQLRLVAEDIGPGLHWRRTAAVHRSMAEGQQQGQGQGQGQQGQWRRGGQMMEEEETPGDAPLDLSVRGPLGLLPPPPPPKKSSMMVSSVLLNRYYPIARARPIDDEKVKVHAAAVTSEADVRLLEEIDRRRRLPLLLSQQNHLKKYGGTRWDVGPRHLRLLANSFTGEKVTRKRHHVTVEEEDDEGEGGGRIPEVHATPEAVAQLQSIENKIGEYNCMLCGNHYEDAFELANHNCSCIVKVVHRCPECNKVFQCPANLASHRRWHGIRGAHLDRSFPDAPEEAAAAAAAKASPLPTSS